MSLNSATLVGVDKLADGETAGGLLCPRCSGGTSKEHSFSVTKTRGKLLYHCHRATCGYSGAEYLSSLDRELDNESSQKVPRSGDLFFRAPRDTSYRGPQEPIPPDVVETLSQRWSLTEWHLNAWNIRFINRGTFRGFCGRIALPVIDPRTGTRSGLLVRALDPRDKPKTLLYSECTSSLYLGPSTSKSLVLVEDVISSIRLSRYTSSLALLGTSLNQDKSLLVRELVARYRYSNLVLALDKDALGKSITQVARLRLLVPVPVQVVALNKDLKNHTEQELTSWLKEHTK